MKRILALFLSIVLLSFSTITAFSEETDGIGEQPSALGENTHSDTDIAVTGAPDTNEELTPEDKKELINSVSLDPIITNYEPLDELVEQILSGILTPNMSTYEKVYAIYKYLTIDTKYEFVDADDEIAKTYFYSNILDYNIVRESYQLLTKRKGVCNHFSSAFMVLTRAVGLDSYVVTCTNSSSSVGGHYSSMICINGELYYFDPVMEVVGTPRDNYESSKYFCAPIFNSYSSEYSYLREQMDYFNGFQLQDTKVRFNVNHPTGGTDEMHFTFGSYPQTRVTDSELINELNERLNGVTMTSYRYSYGNGERGSQTQSDFMSWADITYENEKYRAVKIDDYRSKFIYTEQSAQYSMQKKQGYTPGNVYWFRYDPIEWRKTDESLLVADLVLDAQPFNDSIYVCEEGKVINGRTHYTFKDPEYTLPANDWEVSSIRRWLNDEFYNTAFSSEEKEQIVTTRLDENYGCYDFFDYQATSDKVFLLSKDDISNSDYWLANSKDDHITDCTDYARSQGANRKRLSEEKGYASAWMLRSAGIHSEDIFIVGNTLMHPNVTAACTLSGIRPAIRIASAEELIPETITQPETLDAAASETGQITVKAGVVNGAEKYKFYCYSDNNSLPERVIITSSPLVKVKDLTPGTNYRFRTSALYYVDGSLTETPLTDEVSALCRTFVTAPTEITTTPTATGELEIRFEPVEGAVRYNIYRYVDADTLELCETTDKTSAVFSGLSVGTSYSYKVSSISADGYESVESKVISSCICQSIPPRPDGLTGTPVATGEIDLAWNAVEGAGSYNVYRYIGTDLTFIGTTDKTEYHDTDLRAGDRYFYKVEAVSSDGKDISAKSYTFNIKCESIPPVPKEFFGTTVKTGSVQLEWQAAEGAGLYHVYCYSTISKAFEEIGSTSDTKYIVTGLTPYQRYSFQLTAETADGRSVSTPAKAYVDCGSIPPRPEKGTGTPVATGEIDLTWDAVEGAGSYNVYRYVGADLTLIGTTDKNEYHDTGLRAGDRYFYKIEAVSPDGNDISAKSDTFNILCESIPPVPKEFFGTTVKTGIVQLEWQAAEGAALYHVYCYSTITKAFEEIGSTSDTKYIATGLTPYQRYSFQLTAETADGRSVSSAAKAYVDCGSIPPRPEGVTGTLVATGEIDLTWDAVEGAGSYNVYRYIGTELMLIGATDKNEYHDTDLKAGNKYFYKIEAVSSDGKDISAKSDTFNILCESIPPVPKEFFGTTVKTGIVQLEWQAAEGAGLYHIYCYSSISKAFEEIGSTSDTKYIVTGLTPYQRYLFQLTAETADGRSVSSAAKAYVDCGSFPSSPVNVTAAPVATGEIDLTWDAVEGAGSYNVYRYIGSDLTLIGTTDINSYRDTDLRVGDRYFYKIEAVSSDGEDISAMSETINIKCESIPAAPTGLEVGAAVEPYSVDLTWNAVEDATGYEIYRYMGAESGYEPIGRTDKTEYKVTGLKNGAKHNFRVAAIKEEADYTHISNLSDSAGAIPKRMAAPTGLTASVTEAYEITLNWDKNEYADRYDINIYDSDKKVYVYAGSTEKTSYTIGELAPNVNYVFRIEGVAVFENEEFKSALSDSASCKTMGGPDPVTEVEYISKDNDSKLRWSASKTATRYRVYASAALPDEEDELIGETDKTELSLNTLTPNTMYRLYIVAVKVQDNLTLSGKPSDIFTIFMPPISRYILGDADGSGDVDIVDATIIQRYSTMVKVAVDEETLMHGDINGDGYLDTVDATFIQRYSTFIKVPYPIGTFV